MHFTEEVEVPSRCHGGARMSLGVLCEEDCTPRMNLHSYKLEGKLPLALAWEGSLRGSRP